MESNWIRTSADTGDVCPVFRKQWRLQRPVKSARLELTALGTYVVRLNGEKLGWECLLPAGPPTTSGFRFKPMTWLASMIVTTN